MQAPRPPGRLRVLFFFNCREIMRAGCLKQFASSFDIFSPLVLEQTRLLKRYHRFVRCSYSRRAIWAYTLRFGPANIDLPTWKTLRHHPEETC